MCSTLFYIHKSKTCYIVRQCIKCSFFTETYIIYEVQYTVVIRSVSKLALVSLMQELIHSIFHIHSYSFVVSLIIPDWYESHWSYSKNTTSRGPRGFEKNICHNIPNPEIYHDRSYVIWHKTHIYLHVWINIARKGKPRDEFQKPYIWSICREISSWKARGGLRLLKNVMILLILVFTPSQESQIVGPQEEGVFRRCTILGTPANHVSLTSKGMAKKPMTMSARARLEMKKLVMLCIVLEEATIQMTMKLPTTAMTEMDPYNMDSSTIIPVGTS